MKKIKKEIQFVKQIKGRREVMRDLIKKEEEKRKLLLKKAREGDEESIRILKEKYHLRLVDPAEYLQEKEAERKNFPMGLFKSFNCFFGWRN